MPFQSTLEQHQSVIHALGSESAVIERLSNLLITQLKAGNKILWAGNGGSAADAQHMAAELVVRFRHNRKALPSLALTTDTSILTAASNDLGFESIFARQVQALGQAGDVLILLSTSGRSPNCILAAETAQKQDITTISLTGDYDSLLSKVSDWTIKVPSQITARIQEAHGLIAHYWCEQIERAWLD